MHTDWQKRHAKTIWTRYLLLFFGFWLLINLPTFGFPKSGLFWSDAVCGVLIIILSLFSLSYKNNWASWLTGLIGMWLQLAPLVFWAPSAYYYLNDTLTGVVIIGLSILIPGTSEDSKNAGSDIPNGWSYNPSSWVQRMPVIGLACICWFCSRYMAAFQLGYIDSIWDPVFGNGTLNVITSSISKDFPVSDAGLGAAVYTVEALMGAKGSAWRWKTMPWMVTFFGILVIPAGIASIILIMLQPLLIGSWCFWCLLTAACMLFMITLTLDEVAAVLQFLKESTGAGKPFRQVFWKGAAVLSEESHGTNTIDLQMQSVNVFSEAVKGVNISWNLALSFILGIWLLFHSGPYQLADDLAHVLGALTITVSIISMAEVTRIARFGNILLGLLCMVLPLLIASPAEVTWKAETVGILLILLSLRLGKIKENYGLCRRYIK